MTATGASERGASAPELTVIVPAYDESTRLTRTLPVLLERLADWPGGAELIVVDDGSSDDTAAVATSLTAQSPCATVIGLDRHQGKGAAVRRGLRTATGRAVVFMDADLATDLDCLPPLVAALAEADVAIGSRSMPGSDARWAHGGERLRHQIFGRLAGAVSGVSVRDFQCGFKALRPEAARLVGDTATENGFAFDVEMLVIARNLDLRIVEVPVRWTAQPGGHVRTLRDAPVMLARTLAIRRRSRRQ